MPFVRPPSASHNLRLPGDRLLNKRAAIRARKIFVVKQTSHLPATNAAAGETVRRILIFDNHPDSLQTGFRLPPRRSTWRSFWVAAADKFAGAHSYRNAGGGSVDRTGLGALLIPSLNAKTKLGFNRLQHRPVALTRTREYGAPPERGTRESPACVMAAKRKRNDL